MEDDVRHLAGATVAVDVVAQLCEPVGVVNAHAASLAVLTRRARLDILARAHVDVHTLAVWGACRFDHKAGLHPVRLVHGFGDRRCGWRGRSVHRLPLWLSDGPSVVVLVGRGVQSIPAGVVDRGHGVRGQPQAVPCSQ
eukprot:1493984-Prymnesium_polylepis.2